MEDTIESPLVLESGYAELPGHFHARVTPVPVVEPTLVELNRALCAELGLDPDALPRDGWAAVFSGNRSLQGARPVAMAYAGHQFGHFVPQLGDGRAVLLGEVVDHDGRRREIQLKGAGRNPFSRQGDGRAPLGPVLREYLVSEAMHALGIPSTRALAAVTTGETVRREELLPGAILTRVAYSHVRVGTFQYFAARGDTESVRLLCDYVIGRLYPELRDAGNPALALLDVVAERQALLVARWMCIGFIHGVMNTDNMAISGETIDYGPCAFLDDYAPGTVYSAVDQFGRYAYGNQPGIAQWNLARFAEALLPLIDREQQKAIDLATEVVAGFRQRFDRHWTDGMRRKIGLSVDREEDQSLVDSLLDVMDRNQADFTLTFRRLCDAAEDPTAREGVREQFADPGAFDAWARRWQERMQQESLAPARRAASMRALNPARIPRNHSVEQALAAAVDEGDFTAFREMLAAMRQPYADVDGPDPYAAPPRPDERIRNTFCGT